MTTIIIIIIIIEKLIKLWKLISNVWLCRCVCFVLSSSTPFTLYYICQGPSSFMYEIVLICWVYYCFPCYYCCHLSALPSYFARLSVRLFNFIIWICLRRWTLPGYKIRNSYSLCAHFSRSQHFRFSETKMNLPHFIILIIKLSTCLLVL